MLESAYAAGLHSLSPWRFGEENSLVFSKDIFEETVWVIIVFLMVATHCSKTCIL